MSAHPKITWSQNFNVIKETHCDERVGPFRRIGHHSALRDQNSLINVAAGYAHAHEHLTPPDVARRGWEDVILVTAKVDEHGKEWDALVYSANKFGTPMYMVGRTNHDAFIRIHGLIANLQTNLSIL